MTTAMTYIRAVIFNTRNGGFWHMLGAPVCMFLFSGLLLLMWALFTTRERRLAWFKLQIGRLLEWLEGWAQ